MEISCDDLVMVGWKGRAQSREGHQIAAALAGISAIVYAALAFSSSSVGVRLGWLAVSCLSLLGAGLSLRRAKVAERRTAQGQVGSIVDRTFDGDTDRVNRPIQ